MYKMLHFRDKSPHQKIYFASLLANHVGSAADTLPPTERCKLFSFPESCRWKEYYNSDFSLVTYSGWI